MTFLLQIYSNTKIIINPFSFKIKKSSKGEKVECLFPANEGDEFTYMPFANKTGQERMDHAYDPVPGEPPIAPMPDYELGAPYSWFEYETDNRLHSIMVHDQVRFF